MSIIELRSDTFTRPTPDMLDAMVTAPLGDDVYGEDPTVRLLEEKAADAVGKPAACLMPSGTMANLAALTAHAPRGSRVLVGRDSDIYMYEAHGVSVYSGVALDPIAVEYLGWPIPAGLAAAAGGLGRPAVLAGRRGVRGEHREPGRRDSRRPARPGGPGRVRAAPPDGRPPGRRADLQRRGGAAGPAAELARHADSVQFCLSKGLSAPIGSVVAGPAEFIGRVRRVRKMLGGGMRQAGVIAAAGIVALDTMVDRLAADDAHARLLAEGLHGIDGISVDPARVRTNIVLWRVDEPGPPRAALIALAAERGVRVGELGRGQLRAQIHREISRDDIHCAVHVIGAVVRDWRKERTS